MNRQNNPVKIYIPRRLLQNPGHENPLQQLLGTDASLQWIDRILDNIKSSEQITAFVILVDDDNPLSQTESDMLLAAQNYINESAMELRKRRQKNITEIPIPRSLLQNPNSNDEPRQLLLGITDSLTWVNETLEKIARDNIASFLVVVNDTNPLNPSETLMLQAAQEHIDDHVKNMRIQQESHPISSSSDNSAAAAAAACTTPVAVLSPAPQHPFVPLHNALLEASTSAAAACIAAVTTTEDQSSTAPPITTTTIVDALSVPTAAPIEDSKTPHDNAASELSSSAANEKPALNIINAILHLVIWSQKGQGLFSYDIPDGIKEMKALNNPSLSSFREITQKKQGPSSAGSYTRKNMTTRFYAAIIELTNNPSMSSDQQMEFLGCYAKQELIINHNSQTDASWRLTRKINLIDADIETLCRIAGIKPAAIEQLAKDELASSAATAAAAAPQTELRP